MTDLQGRARPEAFLALNETGDLIRTQIISAVLQAHHAADGLAAMAPLLNPQPGDLVLELTRSARSTDPRERRIGLGYLIGEDSDTGTTAVQYGPAAEDVCDWNDGFFLRVPARLVATAHAGTRF